MHEIAILNVRKAHYLKNRLAHITGFEIKFGTQSFNEFVLQCQQPAEAILNSLKEDQIIGGFPLEQHYPELKNCLLVCATELNSQRDMDRLADKLEKI